MVLRQLMSISQGIMMSEEQIAKQIAQGNYIAQADQESTAIVAIYQGISPRPIDEAALIAAQKKLMELPLEIIPEVGPVPPGSLMPFIRNRMFVGRKTELFRLAFLLKGGEAQESGRRV